MKLATGMMHGTITLAVLSAVLLIATPRAQAQTNCPFPEGVPGCVLYNFSGLTDGANQGPASPGIMANSMERPRAAGWDMGPYFSLPRTATTTR